MKLCCGSPPTWDVPPGQKISRDAGHTCPVKNYAAVCSVQSSKAIHFWKIHWNKRDTWITKNKNKKTEPYSVLKKRKIRDYCFCWVCCTILIKGLFNVYGQLWALGMQCSNFFLIWMPISQLWSDTSAFIQNLKLVYNTLWNSLSSFFMFWPNE